MSGLRERLAYNKHIGRYVREVGCLLGRMVDPKELLSQAETERVLSRAKGMKRAPGWKRTVDFQETRQPRFSALIASLDPLSGEGVYVLTPLSAYCGLLPPLPLSSVDFEFPFDLNPEGIFEVLTADLGDRMLLDFSRDGAGCEVLELEVDGARWGAVAY